MTAFFFCAACGRETQIRGKFLDRPYTGKDNCLHPELQKIVDRICASCYGWDYDAHKRMRNFQRTPLKLKDGKLINPDRDVMLPTIRQFRDDKKQRQ